MDEIDNLNNSFNNCNISENNQSTKDICKFYFNTFIEKMKINNECINCCCSTNSTFIIGKYCTMGNNHDIKPEYNIIFDKNFLYYSYDDFIKNKPYIVIII
jgi:exonuclease III